MLVADQLVGVPTMPLKVTVLVPCVAPKLVPVRVTGVPTGPLTGARLVMLGGGLAENALKAANPAPHMSDESRVAPAEAVPAAAWMRSSTIRTEVGVGTLSRVVYPLPAV